jgi:hypothetical protein
MATKDDQLHRTAFSRFERVETKERNQRRLAIEDLKFAQTEDGQWDEAAIEKRSGRPRYTINRIAGAIDQLIGDQRQNRTSIKIRPVAGGATEDVAETLTGLIRNIETQSKAENAYDCAFDEVVNGGYGGWRVVTDFNDDDAFEQDIRIKPLMGATTSLWFDDAAKEYDKRDAMWAFVTVDMSIDEHKERFPNSAMVGWSQEQFNSNGCSLWKSENTVKVAEYWRKMPFTKEIAKLSDGRVIDLDEDGAALNELAAKGIDVLQKRKVQSHKVEMVLMDGGGVLGKPKQWAGKYIPLIPVYGRQCFIEGREYTRGLVRFAKDANRIYNYATSAAIETAALTPKDPIWITPKQTENFLPQLRNFNTQNSPFMMYNPDPNAPGIPGRGGAPAVQGAFLQQIQQASMDLYHVTNMQPPSLGANPELKSGKAIQAQEKLGDRGSFIFSDNLAKSIEYTAEILVDLMPRIYDTPRQARIMARDGETELVEINQTVFDEETRKDIIVNDLSLGKYDVVAETGPAFSTQRQESAEQIISLISQSPLFEGIAMDLVAKDLPILESKELTKRVRKLYIQQGTIEPTEEEIKELGLDQPQQPDKQQEAITTNIEMQTEELMGKIEERDAKTLQITIDTQNSTIKAYKDLMDAYKVQRETGIPLTSDDRNIILKQQDIIEEAQQNIDEGPNREQAASMVQEGLVPQKQADQGDTARRLTVEQPSASAGQDIVN